MAVPDSVSRRPPTGKIPHQTAFGVSIILVENLPSAVRSMGSNIRDASETHGRPKRVVLARLAELGSFAQNKVERVKKKIRHPLKLTRRIHAMF